MRALIRSLIIIALTTACANSRKNTTEASEKRAVAGFYNLENLFDTINTEGVFDEEYTPRGKKHWNAQRYRTKTMMLADVIKGIGDAAHVKGPAIMGLSEVENINVIKELLACEHLSDINYKIVHQDSPDRRGIDVALIYRPDLFVLDSYKAVPLFIYDEKEGNRIYTRDQLLVSGKLLGEKTHFIINHWPSRYGGEERSRPLRKSAAELSRSIIDSIQADSSKANIILMGDLNDDPHNVSVKDILRAVVKSELKNDDLYNPLAEQHCKGIGTLCYHGNWNMFDQMVITQNLLSERNGLQYKGAHIYSNSNMKVKNGNYAGYPFRTYVGNLYTGGYSDHFPVYVILGKKK